MAIDVIGNPANYPADWLTQLDKQKALPFNSLLVSDDGVDLIPDNTSKEFKFSNKANSSFNLVYTSNAGTSYTTVANFFSDFIRNSKVNITGVNDVLIQSYTSKNKPTNSTDPLKVLQVQPKALFTNSHSIYQGNGLSQAITGKIATSNALVKLESKVLENATEYSYMAVNNGDSTEIVTMNTGDVVFNRVASTDTVTGGVVGNYYKRVATILTASLYNSSFGVTTSWVDLGTLPTLPINQPTNLTADTSSASKSFTVLEEDTNGEILIGLYGMELVPNAASANDYTLNDTANYPQLTNGTTTDDGGNVVRTYHGSTRTGIYNK